MFKNLKKIIQNVQTADEAKKKRWLFVLSAITMILVIGFWAFYLNKTITSLRSPETAESADNQPSIQDSKESAWQTFLTGFETLTSQIKELITATRNISIETNPK